MGLPRPKSSFGGAAMMKGTQGVYFTPPASQPRFASESNMSHMHIKTISPFPKYWRGKAMTCLGILFIFDIT